MARKYTVPIETRTMSVYVVEAKSATEAAFVVATELAADPLLEPTTQHELSRKVHSARPVLEDTDASF